MPCRSAVPTPYQPVRPERFCDQANTHGIARRLEMPPSRRRDGREPMRRLFDHVDRRGGAEIGGEVVALVHQCAVVVARDARQLGGDRPPCLLARLRRARAQAGAQHRAGHLLQVAQRQRADAVLAMDHLALLGDPHAAIDGAARRGDDRAFGLAATATDRAAATMEEHDAARRLRGPVPAGRPACAAGPSARPSGHRPWRCRSNPASPSGGRRARADGCDTTGSANNARITPGAACRSSTVSNSGATSSGTASPSPVASTQPAMRASASTASASAAVRLMLMM